MMSDEDSESKTNERPSTLLTKLRKKFFLRDEDTGEGEPERRGKKKSKSVFARPGNVNALKKCRKIQIDLKVDGRHIRKEATGGGRKEARMDKKSHKKDIISKAKGFFFPPDNKFGPLDEYNFDLENFEERKLDDNDTIAELYESTGLPLLRFYLTATSKCIGEDEPTTSNSEMETEIDIDDDLPTIGLTESSSCSSVAGSTTAVYELTIDTIDDNLFKNPKSHHAKSVQSSADVSLNRDDIFPKTQTTATCVDLGTPTVQARVMGAASLPPEPGYFETILTNPGGVDPLPLELPGTAPVEVTAADGYLDLPIVNDLSNYEDDSGDPIVPNDEDPSRSNIKVKLHRGHILRELTDFFINADLTCPIEVEMVMPNGQTEPGEDFGGVLRDALSEFWEDFYILNTVGEHLKVPCFRDNMTKEKWQATAKILVMGYTQEGFFPYKLALPFLKYVMDGDGTEINQNHPSLIPTFLEFVPESEKEVMETGMKHFENVDEDDLYDVLENYQVKRSVTRENVRDILQDAAHRTLIQATSYICRCWHHVFVDHLRPALQTRDLEEVCQTAIPTTKRVIDALKLPQPATEEERNTCKLLIRFIKSLSAEKLMAFMRYTTGANQMLGKKVTVRFVHQTDFKRRPVAHTCGCILELVSSFKDYIEFRAEFTSVLDSKIWVMDIM